MGRKKTWMGGTKSGHDRRWMLSGLARIDRGKLGLLHHDSGVLHAFAADDAEQHGGVAGMQAYAAVRRRPAKLGGVVAAVDGKTAVEEDRVRHRRIVVFVRE